jgi:hypothetical protein
VRFGLNLRNDSEFPLTGYRTPGQPSRNLFLFSSVNPSVSTDGCWGSGEIKSSGRCGLNIVSRRDEGEGDAARVLVSEGGVDDGWRIRMAIFEYQDSVNRTVGAGITWDGLK